MVVVSISVEGKKQGLYMDTWLQNELKTNVQKKVQKKDFDYLFCVDGEEGSGKSVFAMQIAKVLDPRFNVNKLAFTPKEFVQCITKSSKYSCVIFDEAFTGLSSRSALSEINQLMISLMMEMRQRNLFVIIVMPSVFMLDKYVALHRARCLFHVYLNKEGRRGYWSFYPKNKLKDLFLKGKRTYSYWGAKAPRWGNFADTYTINEDEYRNKKHESLNYKKRITRAETYKAQRDTLLFLLYEEGGMPQKTIAKKLKNVGIFLGQSQISMILDAKRKEFDTIDANFGDVGENTE